jgi:hypothetical protein
MFDFLNEHFFKTAGWHGRWLRQASIHRWRDSTGMAP